MKEPLLEPGLLRGFRVATGLRLIILALLAGTLGGAPFPVQRFALRNLAEPVLLLILLLWPGLPRRLGRTYLPVMLVIASVLPILFRQAGFMTPTGPRPGGGQGFLGSPELIMALLVPTVIAAWQYDVRAVIGVVLGTTILESGLVFSRTNTLPAGPVLTFMVLRIGMLLLLGFAVVYLVAIQRDRREALERANVQLARHAIMLEQLAVTRERNRLAREMHDTLAHTLSGLAVQLEAVRSMWQTDTDGARRLLDQALQTTRTGLTESRRALQNLRASPLDDLGLALALRQLAESVAARTGAALTVRTPDSGARFPPEVEQSVYRVAQEALENVARHADASHITVVLDDERSRLLLTVSDDGRGFDPGTPGSENGFGLRGIRERADMLGGTVEIDSRPGGPTALRLAVPLST